MNDSLPAGLRVCWIAGTRYTQPLSATHAKKWAALVDGLHVEIRVVSFARGVRPRQFEQYARFYLLPALPLPPLRYLTMYTLGTLLVLWLILRGRAQVLVAHDPYFGLVGAWARGIARLLGKHAALVIETRGDLEQALFMQRKVTFKAFYRLLMRRVARYATRRADVLRAVSASSAEQLQALAPGKPLMQFMSWTDADAFRAVQPEKPVSERCELVYAGVLVPRKGVHLLLDAFAALVAALPAAHLWIIGSADNADYAADLRTQAARLGVAGQVGFIAHLPQRELAQQMARARVFVLPTFSEGLPKVVLEAMLCGTPVIASAVDGVPELVQHGVTGWLLPPGDVPALTAALREAFGLAGAADVDAMGAAARAFAQAYYAPEAYVRQYGELFAAAYRAAHPREHV